MRSSCSSGSRTEHVAGEAVAAAFDLPRDELFEVLAEDNARTRASPFTKSTR